MWAINMHGNYYYMMEGRPHMWAINMHLLLYGGWEPSPVAHVWAINVHGNYYYMVEGRPHMWAINMHLLLYSGGEPSHVGKLTCMVITTIWWRGHLTCGQLMCTCYYMVEGSPHVWLTCGN